MKSRNPDGRFRNHNQPAVLTDHMLRARWLEGEVLRLKRLGFSFEAIAQQITEVGRWQKAPLTPLPEGLSFPSDYSITPMGCHRALGRALKRAPHQEADELRRIDTDRCEDMYLCLSPAIRRGDPQAVRAAVQVLALKAAINGYKGSELELRASPGVSWSSVLTKDQTVDLFKQAMTLLVESGIRIEEMTRAAGLEPPAIEVKATKAEGNGG
jgi:hypothetical protein